MSDKIKFFRNDPKVQRRVLTTIALFGRLPVPRRGTADAEIKPPPLVVAQPGAIKGSEPEVGQTVALHALPDARTSAHLGYFVSAFLVHSTSFFPPIFSDRKQLNES